MSPRLLRIALLFFLSSCRSVSSPPSAPLFRSWFVNEEELTALSNGVENALRVEDEGVWTQWTTGETPATAQTLSVKEALFSRKNLNLLKQAARGDPEKSTVFTHLRTFLTGEALARLTWEKATALNVAESTSTFEANDQTYAYRELPQLLAQEKSAFRRKALYVGAGSALKRVGVAQQELVEVTRQSLKSLGYSKPADWAFELRQASAKELSALVNEVLRQTDALYSSTLELMSPSELNFPSTRLVRADLPRLFRARETEALFPADKQWPTVERTLVSMGLPPSSLPNLKVEFSDATPRMPGALAVGVSVPQDIRLSIRPENGARSQARLLHEVGHGLKYASTGVMRFELAKLGNVTFAELFAYLFEELMADPLWLEQMAGLTPEGISSYRKAADAQRLFRLRQLAARLLFQLERLENPREDGRLAHARLTEHLKVLRLPEDDDRIFLDEDALLTGADELRARILAAQLRQTLRQKFGQAYWQNPATGSFLKSLWEKGNSLSIKELGRLFGAESYEPSTWVKEITPADGAGVPGPTDARPAT